MNDKTTAKQYLSDEQVYELGNKHNPKTAGAAYEVIEFYEPAYHRLLAENAALKEEVVFVKENAAAWERNAKEGWAAQEAASNREDKALIENAALQDRLSLIEKKEEESWNDSDIEAAYLTGCINGASHEATGKTYWPSLDRVQVELQRIKTDNISIPSMIRAMRNKPSPPPR